MKQRHIYFIKARGMGGVKIGCSTDVLSRMAALQRHSIAPLYLVGSVPGTMAQETEVHAVFHKQRMHGEWFKSDRTLSSFIRTTLSSGQIALPTTRGKKPRRQKQPSPEALRRAENFGELYKSGQTLKEIGDQYNLSRERVRQILGLVGISGGHNQSNEVALRVEKVRARKTIKEGQIQKEREKKSARNKKVVRMYRIGNRYSDIAKACGVSITYISRILHAEGVSPDRLST